MDYTREGFRFKLRKVLRYTRLYGPSRTWVKVRGQYHMARRYTRLPRLRTPPESGGHVGIIGCGNFGYSVLAYYLRRNFGRVLRGAMDADIDHAASLFKEYGFRYYTDDAEELLADREIKIVFIASNHASHAEYAVEALRVGKAVHIEKPHCVTESQLLRLCRAMQETGGKVALGFNRPDSRFGRLIRRSLEDQDGAAMLNWFVAGHQIDPNHWYFREEEGGRVLGNLCHWTDFVYQMIPAKARFPITIAPTRADRSDADIAVTYRFGDGSIAAITFSAKGHTFEGVRERFAAHKGDLLVTMDDFKTLTLELVARKQTYQLKYRDHGHEQRVKDSYRMIEPGQSGAPIPYVWETGLLFLKTREALEERRPVVIESFQRADLKE